MLHFFLRHGTLPVSGYCSIIQVPLLSWRAPENPPATAGFILGRLIADEAEILTLGVCENRQRRGIGQRLVEALGRAARKAEARRLYLEVAASNATALRLYQKLGFAGNRATQGLL